MDFKETLITNKRIIAVFLTVIIAFSLFMYWIYAQQPFRSEWTSQYMSGATEVQATFYDPSGDEVSGVEVKKLAWVTTGDRVVATVKWSVDLHISYKDLVSPLTVNVTLVYPTTTEGESAKQTKTLTIPIKVHSASIIRRVEFDLINLPKVTVEPPMIPKTYRLKYEIYVNLTAPTIYGDTASASDAIALTASLVWKQAWVEVKIVPSGAEQLAIFTYET